jgi:hypothetical protein
MQQATNYGSLIAPHTTTQELEKVVAVIVDKENTTDAFLKYQLEQLKLAVEQLALLSNKYHCIVDNPPYMGGGNMNKVLGDYVKINYPDSKADLMACFMEAGLNMLQPKGFLGMINQHSWMFLSSYEQLREKLIGNVFFDTNLHLGARTFPEIAGEVVQNTSFTFWNKILDSKGIYLRLVDFNSSEEKRNNTLKAIKKQKNDIYFASSQKDFEKIPGKIPCYWINASGILVLERDNALVKLGKTRRGLQTGNTERFIRFWYEIQSRKFSETANKKNDFEWCPLNSGGTFRKWYGNIINVVYWKNNGEIIKNTGKAIIPSENLYFKKCVTWNKVATDLSFRIQEENIIPGDASPAFFSDAEDELIPILGILNCNVTQYFLKIFSPTLGAQVGDIGKLPIINSNSESQKLVLNCIEISKLNWNSKEFSWGFTNNELIKHKSQDLEETFDLYQQYWKNKFYQLHKNEEELNRQFIEIYGLQDELTPDVKLEDITILKEETIIENGQLVFKATEVFAQFMSYAVGCMFGRYSLDKEGLILANQGETLEDYLTKVEKTKDQLSFMPDDDNIIPILDDEWFEDDITGRFYAFLKASFGTVNFDKNLAFVEECLGKDVRKYFVKDFYNDHIKRYKKRPIYWMFSSPKGSFNVLIYMHRYTPDTLNKILNGYLIQYREKLNTRMEHLDHLIVSGTSTEQTKAQKEKDKLKLVLIELQEYERETLRPLAIERISIDLDEGVLVNYNKFGKAIKDVAGLNDVKTKKKVKEFDWIDVTQIK